MNEPASLVETRAQPARILMVAGEVSGDRQAAHLARAIRARDETTILFGAGGEEMRRAGVDVISFTAHLGCVGVWESVRLARRLRRLLKELSVLARRERPDLILLVDNEGFNTILARRLRKEGIPIVFYFPPQVWLWGRWRARSVARFTHLVVPAFPDEVAVYRNSGADVEWLGHPLLDTVRVDGDHRTLFARAGLDPSKPTVAVMPGSRLQEFKRLMPTMLGGVEIMQQRVPQLQVILPLAAAHWQSIVEELLIRANMQDRVTVVSDDIYTWLSHCSLAIVKSGTTTLESALLSVPMVVCYQIDTLSYWIGNLLARTEFVAMPNILKGRQIVPELLQARFTVANVAAEGLRILEDTAYARAIRDELSSVRETLGGEGVIDRVAALVLRRAGQESTAQDCSSSTARVAASDNPA